jgi:hypothetical protein
VNKISHKARGNRKCIEYVFRKPERKTYCFEFIGEGVRNIIKSVSKKWVMKCEPGWT